MTFTAYRGESHISRAISPWWGFYVNAVCYVLFLLSVHSARCLWDPSLVCIWNPLFCCWILFGLSVNLLIDIQVFRFRQLQIMLSWAFLRMNVFMWIYFLSNAHMLVLNLLSPLLPSPGSPGQGMVPPTAVTSSSSINVIRWFPIDVSICQPELDSPSLRLTSRAILDRVKMPVKINITVSL